MVAGLLAWLWGGGVDWEPMTVQAALRKVLSREDLGVDEAQAVMSALMLGEVHHGLVGGFLVGMQAKGVTGLELAGFARGMRAHAVQYDFEASDLVDTCGTGGGRATFNLSTGAAILAASCGARVAKHGNRAVTSKCGSADVLEALGVPIEGSELEQRARLEATGLVFLYAPAHHPAVRHVAPVRRELGVRTFFNLLGPLANPAGAKRQMVGVFESGAMESVAEALRLLGVERAFVVHGADGMDEVTPCDATDYIEVRGDETFRGTWVPEDFGVNRLPESALAHGEGIAENAEILREALSVADSPRCHALLPNTAATLVLAGVVDDVREGASVALDSVRSGRAGALLERLAGQ